jgi:transketolase
MDINLEKLKEVSKSVRKDILEMVYKAGSGHPGGSLSAVELLVAIYFDVLQEGDRFFLSNGHICPALYSVMAEKELIDKSLLGTYTELDSPLQGHPERVRLKGIENTSGPLGLGLAQAAGFAAVKKDSLIYCMTSDGEHDEGNHWEAVAFASKYKLGNLIQIVDKNGIQIEGTTEQIMPLGDLKKKYEASNWNVAEIDGHEFSQIFDAVEKAKNVKDKPNVILATTIFGKGVSFMEGNAEWHAKAPSKGEFDKAMEELK